MAGGNSSPGSTFSAGFSPCGRRDVTTDPMRYPPPYWHTDGA